MGELYDQLARRLEAFAIEDDGTPEGGLTVDLIDSLLHALEGLDRPSCLASGSRSYLDTTFNEVALRLTEAAGKKVVSQAEAERLVPHRSLLEASERICSGPFAVVLRIASAIETGLLVTAGRGEYGGSADRACSGSNSGLLLLRPRALDRRSGSAPPSSEARWFCTARCSGVLVGR